MHSYGVRDVERLLRLSRSTLRALIDAGFVAPERGPRNALRFSFQDLIVLRTAQSLAAANIPRRRIVRSLRQLRSRLPDQMPLSGLSIGAIADRVVVREGGGHWQADSGQYLLAFEGDPARGALRVIEPAVSAPPAPVVASDVPDDDEPEAAVQAYQRAIAADPTRLDARINLGRLLHELERFEQAEQTYRDASAIGATEPLLFYNLGVLLDDLGRKTEAMQAYEAALKLDPQLADCHYNLALLYEELEQPKRALRHMSQYRRLMGKARD